MASANDIHSSARYPPDYRLPLGLRDSAEGSTIIISKYCWVFYLWDNYFCGSQGSTYPQQ